jgi:quercetin dioxygenase-like cupin family protein
MPELESVARLDLNTMQRVVGAADTPKKGLPPRHPMMHRTRTLDYAIVLAGEIDMLLDEGEVHLKAGDVLVQQATNHAWVNRGRERCRVAFILLDAEEP